MPEGLKPGDMVVALASAARTAAIVAGVVAGAIAMWIARHKPVLSSVALLGGAVTGWIVGTLVGKIIFPATDGNVVVAKAGPASLPMTLKGNLVATLLTGIVVSILIVLLTKTDFKVIAPASIGAAVLVGIIFALLASLV